MQSGVAVVGTVFIDYKGFARQGYQAAGRNVGLVEIVAGGVARNVAVNMAHLALDTWFVGTLNDDGAGELVRRKMQAAGIHLEHTSFVPNGGSGVWLAILDHQGELLGSVSQMPDIELMEREILASLPAVLPKVGSLALEVDLSEFLARQIFTQAKEAGCKVYALPGNFSVIGKNHDLFKYMECFVCNEVEAGQLFGLDKRVSPRELLAAASAFADKVYLKNFVVTMGEQGSLYRDGLGNMGHQRAYPVKVLDSTGAGDAFFSGVVAALINGRELQQAVEIGSKVASLVICAKESDCSELMGELYDHSGFEWLKIK